MPRSRPPHPENRLTQPKRALVLRTPSMQVCGTNHRLRKGRRRGVSDLTDPLPAAPVKRSQRKALERGELWCPQPATLPVEWARPWPRIGWDRPRRQVGAQLQQEVPEASLSNEGRAGMPSPCRVGLVVPARRHRPQMLCPSTFDDLLRLEELLIRERSERLTRGCGRSLPYRSVPKCVGGAWLPRRLARSKDEDALPVSVARRTRPRSASTGVSNPASVSGRRRRRTSRGYAVRADLATFSKTNASAFASIAIRRKSSTRNGARRAGDRAAWVASPALPVGSCASVRGIIAILAPERRLRERLTGRASHDEQRLAASDRRPLAQIAAVNAETSASRTSP